MSKSKYQYLDEQIYCDGKKNWRVSRLVFLAKELKPFNLPMKHLNIFNLYPKSDDTLGYVKEMKKVLDADLKWPIILDEEGYVMDGRHRVCKALLESKKKIKAVRFKETPDCDWVDKEEEE